MDLDKVIPDLKNKGASDLHLEAGLLPTARIQGELKAIGSEAMSAQEVQNLAQQLMPAGGWNEFLAQNSYDMSRIINGVRCRINVMQTCRGMGLAIRLLSTFQPTLERFNLHPDLGKLVKNRHGLIVVSGPTGSGKSSTLAAMLHEINSRESMHIVTIESPIEYTLLPRRSFIRQREVGRDTPSFDQALIDAMRQDPDVIMVGEMRERETMRLTMNAAETGQLVLSTLHASNTAEAVQRLVAAFPSDIQASVCAQLADCLIAVVAQRLKFHEKLGIRAPVCEVLMATNPTRNLIRQGHFYKLASALETGHAEGNWTFRRYQEWLDSRGQVYVPTGMEPLDPDPVMPQKQSLPDRAVMPDPDGVDQMEPAPSRASIPHPADEGPGEDVIVIDEPDEASLGDLLKKLGGPKKNKKEPPADN